MLAGGVSLFQVIASVVSNAIAINPALGTPHYRELLARTKEELEQKIATVTTKTCLKSYVRNINIAGRATTINGGKTLKTDERRSMTIKFDLFKQSFWYDFRISCKDYNTFQGQYSGRIGAWKRIHY